MRRCSCPPHKVDEGGDGGKAIGNDGYGAGAQMRRSRVAVAGMEEKGGAHGLGFLGLDWMRVLLPEKLSAARTHLFPSPSYRMRKVRDSSRWLTLWVSIWVLVASLIYLRMSSQAVGKRRESLASMCDERARVLQDQLNVSMNQLQALAILVSTFHHAKTASAIDQKTFARYAERTAFERPLTSGVAYGVRVRHADREQFERQQGWSIKKMESSNTKKKWQGPGNAEVREPAREYAPIIFAQDAYKHVISFDLLSSADDRDNLLRARESGKGVLTAPFKLLNNRLGVISTYAVYKYELTPNARPQECIQAAIGYLGGIFDIEALVDKLLHQLAGKQSIMVNVYDTTNERPISMYGSNDTGSGMCQVSTLNFGDPTRKHEMHCRFIQSPRWPWVAITTSIGTLVIGLLIGYIILATAKWIARVQDDYQEMIVLKKRAEDADIAKSQFLATVSHEIRTPVNGVLGMLQMLMDTDLDTTQQDYVTTAQASGKALVSLMSEILDQSKIESGKHELEAVPFDLRTVCDDILSLFCVKAQEKGLELAVFVSDQVPQTLIGDPGRIRQIITNLVGNSMKFTEKGHIYLTVHVDEEIMHCLEVETGAQYANTLSGYPVANMKRSWQNFRHFSRELNSSEMPFALVASDSISLIISVEDTGVGIPFYAQSRVFTPFMQVCPSIGGTGIGLSISKYLVSLMKGEIGFASKPQVGSTFTFTVVLTRAHSSRNENKSSEFKEINALVVDHRPVRAKVTKYHLQRLGVQTELTTDLNQHISKINSGSQIAKLVLIDKETWLKESHLPLLVTKLRNKDQPDSAKLFLLDNPKSYVNSNSHIFKEYDLNVIMKPLHASVLQVSLQRALGWTEKQHCRNGVVGSSTLGSLLHKKRIIIVEDNVICLKVAAGALKKYGAEVTCVDSGKKAIALLKPPHNFDACFMDIQMPGMDGFEATQRIRCMERDNFEQIGRGEIPHEFASVRQRTPIFAMTADIIQATHEECLKSGMDGYVSKPFEREKLYWECARIFQRIKSHSSLELSYTGMNHPDLVELGQDEIVEHVEEKLGEAERKLEEVGMSSMLITMVIKKLTSVSVRILPYRLCYLNKKVVGISLLGLMLYVLVIGAFDLSFNQSLGIRREDENMMLNKFGWSHGRSLMAVENSDMISVDPRKMTGNNDSFGQQQQHWYSRISFSSKCQKEATEMQNGTVKPHQPAHMSHKTSVGLWIALVSVTVLVLGIAVVYILLWCNGQKRAQQNELELSGGIGPRRFQLLELLAATSNFADVNKLGQGGFGPVYKGYLQNQDCHVAIKVLSSQQQSVQGLREFTAEVKVMTQLRHRNIVNLVGWCECDSQQRLLLVYELMAQGSLDKHLYDPEEILTWQQRYKIVLDLGNALLYLHRDCEKCIVHGDIKPANVMLDASYNAKLGDFGLARFIEHGQEPRTTQVIAGTPGYIDPEFIANRWPRAALDVYSFGVVLLEIACGKRPASRQPNGASSLLIWVIRLYDMGMILEAADQRLNGEFNRQQMERVLVTGLWCAHRDPIQRPSIEQAMDVLRSADAELPVLHIVHDERHIRAMEEQAYGDLPVEDHPVDAVNTSTYFTSKDSAYLLAQE